MSIKLQKLDLKGFSYHQQAHRKDVIEHHVIMWFAFYIISHATHKYDAFWKIDCRFSTSIVDFQNLWSIFTIDNRFSKIDGRFSKSMVDFQNRWSIFKIDGRFLQNRQSIFTKSTVDFHKIDSGFLKIDNRFFKNASYLCVACDMI